MSDLSALVGAVIFAWCPQSDRPHRPGPKYRPVLVIDLDLKKGLVKVAYGTKQKPHLCYPGEMLVKQEDLEGLSWDTKFCMGKAMWIPMNGEYLSKSKRPDGVQVTVLGRLPVKYVNHMIRGLEEVQ